MATERPCKIAVVFYRTRAGNEIVRDWLRGLPEAERNVIGQDLMRIQYRWPVSNRIARIMFSMHQGRIVVLHGFIKKTRRTPDDDLELAQRRRSEFES